MNTFKKTVVGFVVILAVLVSAIPAQAQYRNNDPLSQVMNQNMGLTCMGPGTAWIDRIGCVRFSGGQYWLTQGPDGRKLSRPAKIAIGAGIGASAGYAIRGKGKDAMIGAGVGAAIGWLTSRGDNRQKDDQSVVIEGQQVRIGPDGRPVAVGRPGARTASAPSLGIGSPRPSGLVRRAVNRTGMEVAVYHKGGDPQTEEPVMVLSRGGSIEVPLSGEGYDVYILVPTDTLGVQNVRKAAVVPNHDLNGWDIVVAS